MASTPILPFAKWLSGTNQNSVPANDNSLRNQILNGNVISQGVTAQPASPTEGDAYIIAATHTGAQWSTFTPGDLAIFSGGTWYAFAPVDGVVVNLAGDLYKHISGAWAAVGGGVSDGDKGDVVVSGGGSSWALDFAGASTFDNDTAMAANSSTRLPTQAAVKAYVDGMAQGLSWKMAVRAATTANGTLATAFANGQTIDGVTLATGDRFLAKNQTAGAENGIYTVNASGSPTRALDANTGAKLVNATVFVSEGSALADTQWTCSTNAPITVGSTALAFVQLAAVGGGVTSVDAAGGVETTTGSAITGTGTVRGSVAVNPQTGTTYTYLTGDRGKLVTHSNASAIAAALPQATGTFPANWYMWVKNKGAGTLTITPTTSTIDGAATLVLTTGQWALIISDGTNYQANVYAPSAGGLTYITEALSTASPNNTKNAVSLAVTGGSTNADLVLAPKGNGALVTRIPDNSTTGGNKRGNFATDLQWTRNNAAQVASGDYSFVAGVNNTASGQYCFSYGLNCNASGTAAAVAIGSGCTASGQGSLSQGTSCTASGDYSRAFGTGNTAAGYASGAYGEACSSAGDYSHAFGRSATTRSVYGYNAFASGQFGATGDAQRSEIVVRATSTSATPVDMSSNGNSATTTNQLVVPTGATVAFDVSVVARNTSTGDSARWTVKGLAKNVSGTVTLVGTPSVVMDFNDSGASTWSVAVAADNTGKAVKFSVTGVAATTIRWVANPRSIDVLQ